MPLQTCPTKDKWPCPSKPKHDKCVKIKCSEKKPGYSYVTIGNCFGKHIGSIQAEYNGYYGKTCDKYKCAPVLAAGCQQICTAWLLCAACRYCQSYMKLPACSEDNLQMTVHCSMLDLGKQTLL